MVYYGVKELAVGSRTVRNNTILTAKDIPEEKYGFKAVPECRSVAQLLTHIALSYRFQYQLNAVEKRTSMEGMDFVSLMKQMTEEEAKPRNKAQIIELLEKEGEVWASWIDGLTEEFLAQMVAMPPGGTPPYKSRFEMILSVKEHEMHHRGQLMLIERLLGIVPHLTREREARMAQMK
jgi:uncharacterized damage-inducible protein DinB